MHSKALLSAPQWARLLLRRQFEYKSSSIAFKPFYVDIDPAPVQNVILQTNRRTIARMSIPGEGGGVYQETIVSIGIKKR
jgi:hypothetical protein